MNAKFLTNLTLVFCSAFFLFTACAPQTTTPSPKTKTELITASPWKYSQAGVDLDNNGTIDQALPAGLIETCATDNSLTFKVDKSGIVDEGATKCTASSPQMVPFTWSFLNNETEVNFSAPVIAGISGTAKLIELSETKLTISKLVPITGFPISLNVVVILIH